MPESVKRVTDGKHPRAWVESSFTTEPPSASKKRRIDDLAQSKTETKPRPKQPAWISSEFTSQASPSKPSVRPPPPRPQDSSVIKAPSRPVSEFTDPNPTLDPQPKQQSRVKPFAVHPVPGLLPKTPKDDSVHRARDPTLFRIQTPVFQTSISSSFVPERVPTPKDVAPLPPAPRIEVKPAPAAAFIPTENERDFVPLTDLIMPRVLEISQAAIGKGKTRIAAGDGNNPVLGDQFVDEATCAAHSIQNDAEAFGMNDLSLELDPDASLVGHSDDRGRKGANKFIKGGLAARALMVITQREKDDALWHHYQTAKLGKNSNREDLRAHVVQVLQPIGESVLVRCSVPSARLAEIVHAPTADGMSSNALADISLVDVLLSQPGTKAPPAVGPNAVIRLWKPWIEIDLETASRPLPGTLESQGRDKHPWANGAAVEGISYTKEQLAGLPKDEVYSRLDREKLAHNPCPRRALLCSRFVVG